ncbi:hypothetical protein A1F99_060460 [Pyrenophora tritici-repentis]|nr:hypothetical protein A1F99_060460 [Pyrenophora tritici-repentis]
MPIQVTRMAEADIDGAVTTIQEAFADDPYKHWAFPDPSKVRFFNLQLNIILTSSSSLQCEIAYRSQCAADGVSNMVSST